ncbi:hypothetical protein DCAR_0414424 [Daucus carota subsp. sativus]|uniref:Uncharacterized protein n=1 Tax=Daucus carota subsp. sativus TaxID=79200 RepID=A0A175YB52_DAUCS|nr:hypothetical protein DCAR_0414424 [Daucus carota subsp. sativus]
MPSTEIRSASPEQQGNSKKTFEKGTTSKSGRDKTIHENNPQTLLLHIMHATNNDVPDERLESLKNSFKKMNDQANLLIN